MTTPYAQHSSPVSPTTHFWKRSGTWLLIAANLIPLAGVLWFDWRMSELFLLFWLESTVVGGFNVLKMLAIAGAKAIPLCLFFTLHFGGFMAGHLVFISAFLLSDEAPLEVLSVIRRLWPAVLALVISHGVAFYEDFLRLGVHRQRQLKEQMGEPYTRIFVMQLSLIFGGILTQVLGTPFGALILLVVLKIGVDLAAQRRVANKQAAAAWLSPH